MEHPTPSNAHYRTHTRTRLSRYYKFYGDELKIQVPSHSGVWMNLAHAADDIAARLQRLFLPNSDGARPCHDRESKFCKGDPLFYECGVPHLFPSSVVVLI